MFKRCCFDTIGSALDSWHPNHKSITTMISDYIFFIDPIPPLDSENFCRCLWTSQSRFQGQKYRKMGESWATCSICCKKHLKLLQIASTIKWKHLSIPYFLKVFIQYWHIYWSILNNLKQLKGFAATCQNLQQPPKSLKSAILRQNGYWPLTKTNWNSIPMTSEALRLLFQICWTFCSNRKTSQQLSKDSQNVTKICHFWVN